jgi:hypothetical protein
MGPGLPADTHYMGFTRQPMPEGLYTVTVAGVAGDTVTASRVFTDTSGAFIPTIDLIDYTRFSPIDHQTAVPRTPTLSWDVVEGDDLYYAVRVWQGRRLVFADNVFKNKTGLNKGSLTIPRGVLQARTWYTWNVEVCDSDELSEINHCAWLRSVAFRTGD